MPPEPREPRTERQESRWFGSFSTDQFLAAIERESISPEIGVWWGVAALAILGALEMWATWATWGNLSIDAGHEMYVPGVISEGQRLYRDVWYHYGPAAPYFNSLLFRIFGKHLIVLNLAGTAAAFGSALFVFLSGRELGASLPGWTAAAIVLTQAFCPGLFCFPLPYSFSAVYGCLIASALLWFSLRSLRSTHSGWVIASAGAAALAIVVKPEFGVACYAGLACTSVLRARLARSLHVLWRDLALALPGVVVCVAVALWMVSIRGVDFIVNENMMSLPGSYFMKTYGAAWLAYTGLSLDAAAWRLSLIDLVFVVGSLAGLFSFACWTARSWQANLVRVGLILGPILYYNAFVERAPLIRLFVRAFFPQSMLIVVMIVAISIGVVILKRDLSPRLAAVLLTLSFSVVLGFRILLRMTSYGYAIYYDGPAILSYVTILVVLFRVGHAKNSKLPIGAFLVCMFCFDAAAVTVLAQVVNSGARAPLQTAHGTINAPAAVTRNYEAGIAFLKDKSARHEAVLVVPEDTSLYFLADVRAPTRVYLFDPGVLAPGAMTTELFHEIEASQVRFLLWSNRTFEEYGTPIFGTDFNQELGQYLRSHFKPIGPLVPGDLGGKERDDLSFTVWESR